MMNKQNELLQFIDSSSNFLKNFPNLFLIKDLNSNCVGFSDSLSRLLNMDKKALIGCSDDELPWHQYADIYRDCDKKALAGNRVSALQPIQIGKETVVIANIVKIPILNDENEAIGILADASILPVNRDINNALLTLLAYNTSHMTVNQRASKTCSFDHYDKPLKLTQREEECLYLLIRGKSAKIIGRFLSISPRTVEVYIENIKQKLEVSSRTEIIDKAIQYGLFEIIPKKGVHSLMRSPKKWQEVFQVMSENYIV